MRGVSMDEQLTNEIRSLRKLKGELILLIHDVTAGRLTLEVLAVVRESLEDYARSYSITVNDKLNDSDAIIDVGEKICSRIDDKISILKFTLNSNHGAL